jgi:ankyrin repeat protein
LKKIKMIFIFVYNNEQHGNSALHEAAWRGYSQTVTILTQQKANVNAVNRAGFTPLHLCCQNGHNETCRVLLWADANPDAKNHVILFHSISQKTKKTIDNNQFDLLFVGSTSMATRRCTRAVATVTRESCASWSAPSATSPSRTR